MTFAPSPRQSAIHAEMLTGGNILVQACAGSGKTTTMVWLCGAIPPSVRTLALSFNKSIAEELAKRMPAHVRSATMHSLGFGMVRRAVRNVRLDDKKLRSVIDSHPAIAALGQNMRREEIIGDLLNAVPLAQEMMLDPRDAGAVGSACDQCGRSLDAPDASLPLVASIVQAMDAIRGCITFSEMIRHPVVHGYPGDAFDVVLVDECQDLNASQHALLRKLVRPGGQLIAVGDRMQSIYGFRGADPLSMDRLAAEWHMREMPLDISYRCARSVVKLAKEIAGDVINPAPDAPAGSVTSHPVTRMEATLEATREGDMVLARCNAPLAGACLKLLRQGKKATVRGRDIGARLSGLVRRAKASSVIDLIAYVREWEDDQAKKAERARKPTDGIHDMAETLIVIASDCLTVADVFGRLAGLFSDDRAGIVLSTVHKAKGLECDRVVILGPELMPAPWAKSPEEITQERNIRYVAITRAKRELVLQALPPRRERED